MARKVLGLLSISLLLTLGTTPATASTSPLSSYYPNVSRYRAGYYLQGENYANPASPSASVLWFQTQSDGSFRQYNSTPLQTCHWDQLSWKTGSLVYTETRDQCAGNDNETDYVPGIKFMPNDVGRNWTASGTSAVIYYDKGQVACKGTNTWTSKFMGLVALTPTQQAVWVQNNQLTHWYSGADPSGCAAGFSTRWQENFYLAPGMQVQGSTRTDYGLVREVGGNVDGHNATGLWDCDVWFNTWAMI